jgi:hypothetical protein
MLRRELLAKVFYLSVMCSHVFAQGPHESSWVSLFDGKTLNGWKASDRAGSFRVVDGQIAVDGPRSHLFYVGNSPEADYKDFELNVDVLTRPGANSGIYFHTQFQQSGWPEKGFEVQINLNWKDMFMPKPDGQKPIQRRGFPRGS